MSNIIWSLNETAAFRHYFHYYHFVREGAKLTRPELTELTPYHYEAEVLAYDYKEYRNAISENAFKGLPSGS
jgi:hypothetical protein